MIENSRDKITIFFILLFGLIILSLGFSFVLKAGYGNDTISVLSEGIAKRTGLTIGNGSQIINLLAIVLVAFLNHRLIKIGTIITAVAIGFLLDIFLNIIPVLDVIYLRILALMIGIVFAGVGIGITVISKMGASPVDSLMLAINQKFHISITLARIVLDALLTGVGYLLGGTAGFGTILCVLALGPTVNITINKLNKSIEN